MILRSQLPAAWQTTRTLQIEAETKLAIEPLAATPAAARLDRKRLMVNLNGYRLMTYFETAELQMNILAVDNNFARLTNANKYNQHRSAQFTQRIHNFFRQADKVKEEQ